jgi:hypothetical protein
MSRTYTNLSTMPPGSVKAQAAGCTCAVTDNHHGLGYYGIDGVVVNGNYCITADCPVHVVQGDVTPNIESLKRGNPRKFRA